MTRPGLLGFRTAPIASQGLDWPTLDAIWVRGREPDSVRAAHRVSDDHRALDRERVEHRERVVNELLRSVGVRRFPALAVTARVSRDESQSSRDRVGEEVPIAAVVADAVK